MCFAADPRRGEIKSFGVFDFVAQGVQAYVVRRNRAQKKRKHLTLCRNPSGFRPHNQNINYTIVPLNKHCFRFFVPDDFSLPESFFDLRFFINRQIALSAHLPPSSSRNFHRREAIYPLRRRLYQTASASYIQFSSRRTPAKPP